MLTKKTMFYLAFIFFFLALSSCASINFTNRKEDIKTFRIDFRSYAEKGFLFIPDSYYGEYEVLGIITMELHPEVTYREGHIQLANGNTFNHFYSNNRMMTKFIKDIKIEDAIESTYQLVVEWGGDALTNFITDIKHASTDNNPNSFYSYYSVSGIVI